MPHNDPAQYTVLGWVKNLTVMTIIFMNRENKTYFSENTHGK